MLKLTQLNIKKTTMNKNLLKLSVGKLFSTINKKQMEQFNKIKSWWHPSSQMGVLYQYNYQRIQFLRDVLKQLNYPNLNLLKPIEQWKVIDVGCGAGFLAQSLTRLGAYVVGLDPNLTSFTEATNHKAPQQSLSNLRYQNCSIQEYLQKFSSQRGEQDMITSMDVIEHVDNPELFISELVSSLKPGGLILLSTISKTIRSFLIHIIVAEYITGLVPKGTHNYEKFLTPETLCKMLQNAGVQIMAVRQLDYTWRGQFQKRQGGDNYMLVGRKKLPLLSQKISKPQLAH